MEGGPPIFPRDFSCPAVLRIHASRSTFRLRAFHPLRTTFPSRSAKSYSITRVHTPAILLQRVWPLPRSLATTCGISVDFFSSPYLDVSVQAVPFIYLYLRFQYMIRGYCPRGFPHSDICGSMRVCHSPQLFAACHVLLRLPVPRHSPCALCCLTFFENYMGLFRSTKL